ncbi:MULTISPECIES: hypothetical protein [Sphingobacterium]|uniref:hypothetical protein n=1 Tax=Sphingobacterium TaxID=28453 RepID=UPI00257EB407|nr:MULTISPECIES: hypothetical protein [Sphingobacterium]
MALKINIEKFSLPDLLKGLLNLESVNEIYIRIDRYSGQLNVCSFLVGYYFKKEVEVEEDGIMHKIWENVNLNFPQRPYRFTVNESEDENDFNVRKQGYEYLKTLPEFEGCEDC